MRPIDENSTDYKDYGDYMEGYVSEQFNKFINYNFKDEEDEIIEDNYLAMQYAIYFKQKHEYEIKLKEIQKKKDQELWKKALSLLGITLN